MASTKTKVVSVRLRNEVAEYYANKNLKEILENLYEGKETNTEDKLLAISFLYDVDVQDLVVGVKELLDNGELKIISGHLCSK